MKMVQNGLANEHPRTTVIVPWLHQRINHGAGKAMVPFWPTGISNAYFRARGWANLSQAPLSWLLATAC
jgi:hypothetical protein